MSVRVLVVDDSRFYRRRVSEILNLDANLEVVGTANDGAQAVEMTKTLRPDVVTMDVEMPIMDGITATRRIMESTPTPILMFSSLTKTGARATFDALEAGAVDYVPKYFEDIAEKQDKAIATLCRRISQLKEVRSRLKTIPNVSKDILPNRPVASGRRRRFDSEQYRLLVMGTSTGGPVALQTILTKLPKEFPLPILLVQHMPGNFTAAFSQRLDRLCEINVKEAVNDELLKRGTAYIAPGGSQTLVKGNPLNLRLSIEPASVGQIYKPCIDMTFESIAELGIDRTLALILTGMGSDGSEGVKSLKKIGATIWAQDEASSLVSSMPSCAVETGMVERVLPLDDIGIVLGGHA